MASRLTRSAPSMAALSALESALASFRISQPSIGAVAKRHASHQAQGRANGAKDGPGKRLGAKKTGGQYVVPGNIIFRQRGTLWFPGDNCFMGRDHTIHAGAPGYVTYYRDPARHPDRKFIGIVFDRDQTLPQPAGQARRRKLGMLAYSTPQTETELVAADMTTTAGGTELKDQPNESRGVKVVRGEGKDKHEVKMHLRPGGMYRQANWEIGRDGLASKRAQAVKPFKPNDRFAAWNKTKARIVRAAERRAMGRGGKNKKSKAKK